MPSLIQPLQLLLMMFAGWVNRHHQLDVIDFLQDREPPAQGTPERTAHSLHRPAALCNPNDSLIAGYACRVGDNCAFLLWPDQIARLKTCRVRPVPDIRGLRRRIGCRGDRRGHSKKNSSANYHGAFFPGTRVLNDLKHWGCEYNC